MGYGGGWGASWDKRAFGLKVEGFKAWGFSKPPGPPRHKEFRVQGLGFSA